MSIINNADLLPKYIEDAGVILDDGFSPEWIKTLIMVEVRLATATGEGTLKAATKVLDHYEEMGVNALWITPVNDKGTSGNGYGNMGPSTVDPDLSETDNYQNGWQAVKAFVDEAHKRNIRIFLDIITWGTVFESPLITERPALYTEKTLWGGQGFNWLCSYWQKWFIEQVLEIVSSTNIDGFRCDCEPNTTGYTVFQSIRKKAFKMGRKLAIFSEDCNERLNTYDFEQFGVISFDNWDHAQQFGKPVNFYLDKLNIVDSVKTGNGLGSLLSQVTGEGGNYRYYSYNLTNHDYARTIVNGNLLAMGYQAIFAPFIPIWWIGDEFNQRAEDITLYFNQPDWSLLDTPENRDFFEYVKKMIRIRRQYPQIFNYYPDCHRDTNICKVDSNSSLQAYARYMDGKAIMILPNDTEEVMTVTATIPFEEAMLDKDVQYRCVELMSGDGLEMEFDNKVPVSIEPKHLAVVLVERKI